MKKLVAAIAAAIALGVPWTPRLGRRQDSHSVGLRHDLRRLPDHGQEGAEQGRGRGNNRGELREEEAVVTFDDAKTSVQKLTQATEDAGYPSSVKQ